MLGMGAFSTIIAIPLALSARWLTLDDNGLPVGIATVAIGVRTLVLTISA